MHVWARLQSEYVVQYRTHWLQNGTYRDEIRHGYALEPNHGEMKKFILTLTGLYPDSRPNADQAIQTLSSLKLNNFNLDIKSKITAIEHAGKIKHTNDSGDSDINMTELSSYLNSLQQSSDRGTFRNEFDWGHQLGTNRDDCMAKLKEIRIWAKLDTDHFVQYRHHWFDYKANMYTLNIQMDLCWFNLVGAIRRVHDYVTGVPGQSTQRACYFLITELVQEIFKALQILHDQTPVILHRNIKPENILIKHGASGHMVKLANFGRATQHFSDSQTHTMGTGSSRFTSSIRHKYMAWEVKAGRQYGVKADVYSMGVVLEDIFAVDRNRKTAGKKELDR
ncbi:unnamed protein product [Medioppia subpectinata]|uniref:Protein kinase domain-containing protein n=1 Tax=Medioppia subpectinata TaxID=1979941 RepID=A0A7R9Q6F3_9ACAR|nr:unnamed protein product [Medioppia subpectinata]CAG2114359.1 unnamed protein product [Medioppia subpectinata]